MTTTAMARNNMTLWDDLIAATLQRDLDYVEGPVSRGRMLSFQLVIAIAHGGPQKATLLGELGAPDTIFDDPQRVFDDVAAERLNPFAQAQQGLLNVSEFTGRFLTARSPERFYTAPLLYFRQAKPIEMPNARVQGQAEWDAFVASCAMPLPPQPADESPYLQSAMMQRIFSVAWRDGQALQVAEAPAGGDSGIVWEPPHPVWESIALGSMYPTRFLQTTYRDQPSMVLSLFYHKDARHIGYEFGLR